MKGSFQYSISNDELWNFAWKLVCGIMGLVLTQFSQWIITQDFGVYGNIIGAMASAGAIDLAKTYTMNTFTPDNPPTRADTIDHNLQNKPEVTPPNPPPSPSLN